MTKLNAQASGVITPTATSETPTPAVSPKPGQSETVTIDPGAKARAAAASGGAVEPTLDAAGNPIAPTSRLTLTMSPGLSPWTVVLLEILPDLKDQAWQTRHGTSLALLELFRSPNVSLSTPFLLSIARQLLTLLVLDRFGDFVGDTVMAPVRETAGQALGVLLKYLPDEAVYEVHETLLDMVRQSWAKRGKQQDGQERKEGEKFRWEVRHAGLLGIKYEVAVRGDLLTGVAKHENGMGDVKPDVGSMLHDVVDVAIMA
jgi:TATA-binding protein-associated factor